MSGYTPTDEEIAAVVRWLEIHHPDRANAEYARAMLLELKAKYREIGRLDPDKLEDMLEDYQSEQ